jgi:hypothetical protein
VESPAVESSSSSPLLYVLIGLGVVLVLATVAVAIWMSKRSSAQPQPFGGQPMPAGWYPDPHGQARLRWYDGTQWTPNTKN